jgi:hypothetical protein
LLEPPLLEPPLLEPPLLEPPLLEPPLLEPPLLEPPLLEPPDEPAALEPAFPALPASSPGPEKRSLLSAPPHDEAANATRIGPAIFKAGDMMASHHTIGHVPAGDASSPREYLAVDC